MKRLVRKTIDTQYLEGEGHKPLATTTNIVVMTYSHIYPQLLLLYSDNVIRRHWKNLHRL